MTLNDDPDRISSDFGKALKDIDILIVGSGYGGGVAASRLARAGQSVAVLERGREIRPGAYPKDMKSGVAEFQTTISHTGETFGKDYGLYDIRISDNVNVFVGCGLGGTSLINANVAIEPNAAAFAGWPAPYSTVPDTLKDHFARAKEMLGSKPYPASRSLPKLDALEKVAKGMDAPFNRVDINVTFEDGPNHAGVWQAACTDCGDCASGCNYGAKNTVLMNYLPDAQKAGAQLFVGADVQKITANSFGRKWTVEVIDTATGELRYVTTDMVILAAGTFGSTEILLKSQSDDLAFSKKLGHNFSTNGDIWAFGYNANITQDGADTRDPVYCVGAGDHDVMGGSGPASYRPGPSITGIVDLRHPTKPKDENLVIEEGVMPGALAPLYSALYPMIDAMTGDQFRFGDMAQRLQDVADLGAVLKENPLAFGKTAYTGPVSRTLPYLVMGHDSASGELRVAHNRIHVYWPDAGKDATFKNSSKALRKASDAIQAEYLPMPMWEDAFNNRVFSVHPLGGCPMGETVADGAVNKDCQVFKRDGTLHDDLFVMDGAVIPQSLGVNPHLTITAVAERAIAQLANDKTWTIDYTPHKAVPKPTPIERGTTDPAAVLKKTVRWLNIIKLMIRTKPEKVRGKLAGQWDKLFEKFKEFPDELQDLFPIPDTRQMREYIHDDGLKTVVLPIIDQLLELLKPLNEIINNKHSKDYQNYQKAFTHVEEMMGDFSPRLWFPEKMVGHVSTVGLDDYPTPRDPYGIAGMGPINFEFETQISAPSVSTAIADTGEFADIDGTVTWHTGPDGPQRYKLGGKFKFLVPNPDEVECWNMIYEGTLEPLFKGGSPLTYRGFKTLENREKSHWWSDTTEMNLDIYQDNAVIARGILKIGLEEVITQANKIEINYYNAKLLGCLTDAYDELSQFIRHQKREDLHTKIADLDWRTKLAKGILYLVETTLPDLGAKEKTEQLYWAKTFGKLGMLVLRTYGQFLAYMANFQSQPAAQIAASTLPEPQIYEPVTDDGAKLRLTRYEGGTKGPVMMVVGMGANASSFATPTVKRNLAQMLTEDGFDVWLFDFRGSGSLDASLVPFDFDAVATKDWPTAIDTVLANANNGATDVQAVSHCVGSLILFMALLAGEDRVRNVISSQLGPHTLTNWFKQAQIDGDIASSITNGLPEELWPIVDALTDEQELRNIARFGMPFTDPTSPSKSPHLREAGTDRALDPMLDALFWKVPNFAPVPCNSPTCHRVNFFLGPTYQHDQLNQATHDAIKDMFGPVSSHAFLHLTKCFGTGHAVPYSQDIDYMSRVHKLTMPIHFIVGANNPLVLPESSLRTIDWLKKNNDTHAEQYTRKVYQGYGHIDCLIGKNAHVDIFPDIVERLNKTPHSKP